MKKVLIITYYWPPSGGSGVQRCLNFVKHLSNFGWTPVVFTAKNPDYPVIDHSLELEIPSSVEVLKLEAWEPYRIYNFFTGGKKSKTNIGFISGKTKNSFAEKISIWVRGNFFIPDARKFWISPAVRFLNKYLLENKIECIFSSGPPHSAHLIARELSKNNKLPWVADFRDPWTGVYYFNKLKLTECAKKKHSLLERAVLNEANLILVVGETMKNDFEKLTEKKIEVIYNGYEESEYRDLEIIADKKFSIAYTGMFFRDQNPAELWNALKELTQELPGFKADLSLNFTGKIDAVVIESINNAGLAEFLVYNDYVDHALIPCIQKQSQLLLLSINRVEKSGYILTGKVFEYLAARRPILAICPPDSDVARLISKTQAGTVIPFNQKEIIKLVVSDYYKKFKTGNLKVSTIGIEKYTRISLTKQLADSLDKLI